MRMWNVNPEILCNRHLLGEHVEMHMFAGCIRKQKSLEGYIKGGLVEIHNISARHSVLADEMVKRSFAHKSKLPEFTASIRGVVDVKANVNELLKRCEWCRERIGKAAGR